MCVLLEKKVRLLFVIANVCLKPNSKGYFEKIKKNLIQYIPTVNK